MLYGLDERAIQAIRDNQIVFIKDNDRVVGVVGSAEFAPLWEHLYGLRAAQRMEDILFGKGVE